eukprot:411029-Rhodomonas_salina.6
MLIQDKGHGGMMLEAFCKMPQAEKSRLGASPSILADSSARCGHFAELFAVCGALPGGASAGNRGIADVLGAADKHEVAALRIYTTSSF